MTLTMAIAAATAATAAAAADPAQDSAAQAMEVLERTKEVDADYALYLWNRVTPPDRDPVENWSAEFHSGDLHRVETPETRAVANCRTRAGAVFSVETGEVREGPDVADAACGINTNVAIVSAEWLGPVETALGPAERVRIVDEAHVRQYDVSREGVLLRTTYSENGAAGDLLLTAEAVRLETALPASDMFDRGSLERSFVPDRYKAPPAPALR
jgi:hypothetical protein